MQKVHEAARLVKWLRDNQVSARAFGGAAVAGVVDFTELFGRPREVKDIDLVTTPDGLRRALLLFQANLWDIDRRGIAFNDLRRVTIRSSETGTVVDLFADPLVFNQTIPIGSRLELPSWHLWPADLLALKLQIHEPKLNDVKDVSALLATRRIGVGAARIQVERLQDLAEHSWGFFNAARRVLNVVRSSLEVVLPTNEFRRLARRRLMRIEQLLEPANPSPAWRMRAHLGERVPWYNDVNE